MITMKQPVNRMLAAALSLIVSLMMLAYPLTIKGADSGQAAQELTAGRPADSLYASTSDSNDPVQKAFDGQLTSWWTGIAADSSKGFWIACDLGAFYNINRWAVSNFTEISSLAVRGYEFQVSTDNKSYEKVDSIYEVLNGQPTDRTLKSGVVARYVKLFIPSDLTGSDGIARIAEFHVFGTPISDADNIYTNDYTNTPGTGSSENVLAGRTTGISYSSGDPNDPPAKAFDGDENTWATFWSGSDGQTWIQADLGGEYSITKWVVKNTSIFDGYFICSQYSLQTSEDGTNWTTVETVDNNVHDLVTEGVFATPIQAKFVRLLVLPGDNGKRSNGDDLARIAELEIYVAGNGNLLAAKTTGISYSAGDPNDPPAKAFDGDENTWATIWGGAEGETWIQADLGRTYNLTKWAIKNTAIFDGYFVCSNYRLQTSLDGINWVTADTIDNSDYSLETENVLASPVQASFVRVIFDRGTNGKISKGDDLARVAEFELYGS